MSLTSALNTAKTSLAVTQAQTALVSRNIANVNTEGATRKYANVVTGSGGQVEIRSITQSANSVLFRNMLDSTSSLQQSTAVSAGLNRINEMIGDIANGQTPAALIGTLSNKLSAYAASPNSYEFARAAADAANDIAAALNQGTQTVDTIRRDADDDLVQAATDMNRILGTIEDLNKQIVAGTAGNQDVTDLSDQRDRAVSELAQYVGVTAQTRGNNDLVLYTDSGVTLFDKIPRTVSFTTTQPLVDGQPGNGFRIDGTLVTGKDAVMPIKSGKVAGLVELRDKVATTYQTQLDEMARGLVAAFKETSASGVETAGIFTTATPSQFTFTNTLAAGTYTSGNTVSFTLNYGGKDYTVSGTIPDTSTTATTQSGIQALIDAALPASGGSTALGSNKVKIEIAAGGAITLSTTAIGSKVSVGVSSATAPAGLANGTAAGGTTAVAGLARTIAVAQSVKDDASKIRDGVTGSYNPTKLSGFTDRIVALGKSLAATQTFAGGTDAATTGSLTAFAASSTSWLQEKRSSATSGAEYQQTLLARTKETLSNETGVNLDTETLRMLELERSFQASSKVLSTVNEMLKTLMDAI